MFATFELFIFLELCSQIALKLVFTLVKRKMFFAFSRAWDKEKIFLYSLPSSKPYHLSYSIYKHDAIDIADPSSMQDVCHMNFLIDLAHCGVSVAKWWGIGVRIP